MFSLNRVTIIGNLTRDPEVRYTPNGQAVANYAVATNRRWTTQQGETQDSTEYHEVVAWGKLAEISQQLLSKGKKAYVEGRLQTRSWDAPDGAKRQKTEIIAENIIVLSPRGEGEASEAPTISAPNKPTSTAKPTTSGAKDKAPTEGSEQDIDLSDLPF